ncbi:hypothetical protein QDY63_14595 [Pseudomonas brenneri]|uniref:hypothetical protein n=1 Tax=Pseudomonas brenneri TaxID=129817 RepID=UPI0025A1A66C|nr:hypothetical protein [Pseudomonas brenneri]WJM94042.1 hypothetical protein QDY63_14595 [Pseudomonas brenneri]
MGLISGIKQQLDPCKQYTHCDVKDMVIAMGRLPKCIDLSSPNSLISQVMTACNIIDPMPHIFLQEVGVFGTWELVTPLSNVVIGSSIKQEVYAIGVMSRFVGGDYQAIYFYADGTIIVIDKWHNYLFHMDG